jgi:hypothetical protein
MDCLDRILKLLPVLSAGGQPDAAYYVKEQSIHNGYTFANVFTCILCNENCPSREYLKQHVNAGAHATNLGQVNRDVVETQALLRNMLKVKGTTDRIGKLASSAQQDAVRGALFRYMMSMPNQEQTFEVAMKMLSKYENLEPLVLLELAVWRAECLKQMPSISDDFFQAEQWLSGGWKVLKKVQQNSNSMGIILSLVQPFLGPPPYFVAR